MVLTSSAPRLEAPSRAYICPYDQACSYLEWAAKELKLDLRSCTWQKESVLTENKTIKITYKQ